MNDFVRTSLYEAFHKIIPLTLNSNEEVKSEIVGPICETADSFATNYSIQKLEAGDYLAVLDVGAYGHSMSSNYNLRSRPNELVIQADQSIKVFEYKL
jgi:diaminopimelate decarboxylase